MFHGTGEDELTYLLGQTYPYHHLKVEKKASFPVTDLAFDKDRKPWGAPNDATALLMLAMNSRIINMVKSAKGPVILNDETIEPVTHIEGRGMDD